MTSRAAVKINKNFFVDKRLIDIWDIDRFLIILLFFSDLYPFHRSHNKMTWEFRDQGFFHEKSSGISGTEPFPGRKCVVLHLWGTLGIPIIPGKIFRDPGLDIPYPSLNFEYLELLNCQFLILMRIFVIYFHFSSILHELF